MMSNFMLGKAFGKFQPVIMKEIKLILKFYTSNEYTNVRSTRFKSTTLQTFETMEWPDTIR